MTEKLKDLWRREAAARRATAESEAPTIKREFAGLPCVARRLDLRVWVRSGRLPDFFVAMMLEAEQGKREFDENDMTPAEFRAALNFQRDCVCASLVEPRVAP